MGSIRSAWRAELAYQTVAGKSRLRACRLAFFLFQRVSGNLFERFRCI